jgi:arylsulfatase A-like enzyme
MSSLTISRFRGASLGLLRRVAWLLAVGAIVLPRPDRTPRDLVLVSIDTLRADHLGCYGYDRPTSPHLDALAAASVRFERAVAHAPNTLPSHIALMTSRLAGSFARADGEAPLPKSARTLAEALVAHGFATWGFTDGGYLRRAFGLAQGFEHYEDHRAGIRRLRARIGAWLDEHASDRRRMFLFVHTYDVHSPYAPPVVYRQRFLDPTNPSRFVASTENLEAVIQGQKHLGADDLRRLVDLYDAGIRYVDDEIGLLLRDLDRRGRLRNAIVIVTADHGEELMEHRSLLHWRLFFQPNLHVPLIVRVPGKPPGVVHGTVGLVDVVPTALDLLGLPALPTAAGRSLRPQLDGVPAPPRAVYSEPFAPGMPERSLVTDHHQLLQRGETGPLRLFDLDRDPYSQRNVRGARRRVAARLGKELAHRRAAVEAARRTRIAAQRPRLAPRVRQELEALGYLHER